MGTLEAVSPWKAMVKGLWSEDQPSPRQPGQPHSASTEAAGPDTPQGRARCFQVEGDTLDLRAVTGLIRD